MLFRKVCAYKLPLCLDSSIIPVYILSTIEILKCECLVDLITLGPSSHSSNSMTEIKLSSVEGNMINGAGGAEGIISHRPSFFGTSTVPAWLVASV